MSKPMATVGSSSSHGGIVVSGSPGTLIGGKPAARMNDMHMCPQTYPGGAPHGATPILSGSQVTLIDGLPAARSGDITGCGASLISSETALTD